MGMMTVSNCAWVTGLTEPCRQDDAEHRGPKERSASSWWRSGSRMPVGRRIEGDSRAQIVRHRDRPLQGAAPDLPVGLAPLGHLDEQVAILRFQPFNGPLEYRNDI